MKKNKEHKKGESTIGKINYGFLLFMPLFAIGVTCLVNTFNNQAKEQVNINYKYESNNVTQQSDLINGNIYHFSINITNDDVGKIFYFTSLYNLKTSSNSIVEYENENVFNGRYFRIAQTTALQIFENNVAIYFYSIPSNFECDVVLNQYNQADYSYFSECENIPFTGISQKDLDNIFYDSVDKVTESPLFSWATNSVIYTTMNATCTQLSITAPFIPLLLTYWLIISVIYFLYDIALMLIWLLHDKIHEMRDSLA